MPPSPLQFLSPTAFHNLFKASLLIFFSESFFCFFSSGMTPPFPNLQCPPPLDSYFPSQAIGVKKSSEHDQDSPFQTSEFELSAALGCDVRLEHLAPTIGTVVHGVNLSAPLSDEGTAALRKLLLHRKVIFFRNQKLTTEQHLIFSRGFGPLEVHPFSAPKPGYKEVLLIEHSSKPGTENQYHSDVTWREEPSLGSVLYSRGNPPVGGDTIFVDAYAMYVE